MPTRALVTRYEQDQRLFPDLWHKVGLVIGVVFALAYPFLADAGWMTVGNLALVTIVGAVALMILTGFAGQISLGHAAFLAVGAFTAAILGEQFHTPFWLAMPLAGLAAAAVGLAVGPFALRLKGLYLAIVTIGLLFLVHHVLRSMPDLTHSYTGISVPMHIWFTSAEEGSNLNALNRTWEWGRLEVTFARKLYFVYLAIAVAVVWMAKNLRRSATGRAMIAVRDHDLAASALGVNPARTKITAFGLSSFFAGIAGAMYAYQQGYITIVPPFDLNMSIQYIAVIVLGGIGTIFGAVAGAIAFVALTPLAEVVGEHLPWINRLTSAQQSTLLFSLLVIGFLVFEPLGLFGLWLRIKRYFAAWPFRY